MEKRLTTFIILLIIVISFKVSSQITSTQQTSSHDKIAPKIINLKVEPSSTSAIIIWQTDEPSTSQIIYSLDYKNYTIETEINLTLVTNHSVNITNLNPNKTYFYKIISNDTNNNQAMENSTFSTAYCINRSLIDPNKNDIIDTKEIIYITNHWKNSSIEDLDMIQTATAWLSNQPIDNYFEEIC